MGFIIGAILGLTLTIAIVLYEICYDIKKSNDIGDSSGRLNDFGQLNIILKVDDLSHSIPSEEGAAILRERCRKASESSMK